MRAASVGAASLDARRDAPAQLPTASARSDQRTFATQGDMLNSVKLYYSVMASPRVREPAAGERGKGAS
ncbi:hypothetical protein EVAR_85230_1 [Eumeta japonica]|uniref:Uncharacterized protein n=1 Tax=Eumeta variegata TaxID=151549 RepID=A0A4C1VXS8_EUMVA|nr:hypothetical protein EVAR_85230_1 [Eumeta japonica]